MKDSTLDIYECIEFLMESKKMTVYGLSKTLGFEKPAKLYTILNRRTKPSFDTLVSITRRFEDVNGDWLLRGTGDPFLIKNTPNTLITNPITEIEVLHERTKNLEKQVADRDEVIDLLKQQIMILREVINHSHHNSVGV
ncbi:hypothetical protein [Arundinibacter roseus]|uniref:Uncharacterized protein n=1 Tax=Arundinibacter roseus TaxID=2070510 RepID=A0A4R4K4Q3_9BACT|nr:hypothetical protein [Arundinibacter roseus]TDB62370.1 hypothetical protein EZE20_18485 [Arundinibacter roseus]